MKLETILLIFVFFTDWSVHRVIANFMSSEEHPDVQENVHLQTATEQGEDVSDTKVRPRRDVPDMLMETNWNVPDVTKGTYEDADWHPSTSVLETHSDLNPDSPVVIRSDNIGSDDDGTNQTLNQTQCGEYSTQPTPNNHCRLMAKLPPAGTTEKRCPDMFRCTDDVSFWLHENQNRKEQLKELKETVSELQEELRNHRHRVRALEMQVG